MVLSDDMVMPESSDMTTTALNPKVITLSGDHTISALSISNDPVSIYVILTRPEIDLWSMMHDHWIALGIVIVLITWIVLLFVWRRYIFVRRLPGVPYCSKCNYRLADLVSKTCPECGVNLTPANRIIGGVRNIRIDKRFIILACASIAYLGLWALLPRFIETEDGPTWTSRALAEWAVTLNVTSILEYEIDVHRLVRLDTASGRIPQSLLTSKNLFPMSLTMSRDGTTVFVSERFSVLGFDTSSGRQIINSSLRNPFRLVNEFAVSDDRKMIVAMTDNGHVFTWDLTSDSNLRDFGTADTSGGSGVRFIPESYDIVLPDVAEAWRLKRFDVPTGLKIVDATTNSLKLDLGSYVTGDVRRVRFSSDRRYLYSKVLPSNLTGGDIDHLIARFDLTTGQLDGGLIETPADGRNTVWAYDISSKSNVLCTLRWMNIGKVLCDSWSTSDGTLLNRLNVSGLIEWFGLVVSPDGSRIVVYGKDAKGQYAILLFDLTDSSRATTDAGSE